MSMDLVPETRVSIWNRELVPSLSRWLNVLRHPIGWLAVLAGFSLLVGMLVGQQGWPVLVMCLAVLTLGCVWPKVQVLAITPELKFSVEVASEEDDFQVMVQMRNRFPLPLWGLKVQGLAPLCEEKTIGYVPPLSTSTFRWKSIAGMRGVYPAIGASLSTGFPFGLIECSRVLPSTSSLTVLPRLTESSMAFDCPSGASLHDSHQKEVAVNGELRGLRPYRHGDLMKKCHWAQTARTDSLIVREDEASRATEMAIWLQSSWYADPYSAELAYRATLSLLRQLQRQAIVVEFVLDGRRFQLDGGKREWEKSFKQMCCWQWQEPAWATDSGSSNSQWKWQSQSNRRRAVSEPMSIWRPVVNAGCPAGRKSLRNSIRPFLPAALGLQENRRESYVTFDRIKSEVTKSA